MTSAVGTAPRGLLGVSYRVVLWDGRRRKGSNAAFVEWLRHGSEPAENLLGLMVSASFVLLGIGLVLVAPLAIWAGTSPHRRWALALAFALGFLEVGVVWVLHGIRFLLRRRGCHGSPEQQVREVRRLCRRAEPLVYVVAIVGAAVATATFR